MQYREDFIKFMQKTVTKHNITMYCIGGSGLPEVIALDYNYGMAIIGAVQKEYWEFLESILGPDALYGEKPYAVEFDLYIPHRYDSVFRKE